MDFKSLSRQVRNEPTCLPQITADIMKEAENRIDDPQFRRGLASFLAHLSPVLRPEPSVLQLWRLLFNNPNNCNDPLLVHLACLYVKDLTTEWLLSFCLADGFFYGGQSMTLSHLSLLRELLGRRPVCDEISQSGLVEKAASLWPLLFKAETQEDFRKQLLNVLLGASRMAGGRSLFSIEELKAFLESACGGGKELLRLVQREVDKLPSRAYVLSAARSQYLSLGAALFEFLAKREDLSEGLVYVILARWTLFSADSHLGEEAFLNRIKTLLLERSFRVKTLIQLKNINNPSMFSSLLFQCLRFGHFKDADFTKSILQAPGVIGDTQRVFREYPGLCADLNSVSLEGLLVLLEEGKTGAVVARLLPWRELIGRGGDGLRLLAAAVRAAPGAPELKSLKVEELPLSLSTDDLRTLMIYYRIRDVKVALICGAEVEEVEAFRLVYDDWLQVATVISDRDAAKQALKYANNAGPLIIHILRFKAGQEQFVKEDRAIQSQSYHAFLNQLCPEVPIESVPSCDDPVVNLIEAWKFGDLAAVRAIQADQLGHLDAWSIAKRLPPLLIPEMGEWGEELLQRVWMELIGSVEYCREIDSTLLGLLFERLE